MTTPAPFLAATAARSAAVAFALFVSVLAAPRAARADSATAAAAFEQAEALAKQNKWAEACPLYEVSYQADPQLGALLHLAECHDKIGRTATAWAEFKDAAEIAASKKDPREPRIRKRVEQLAGQLARLRLTPPRMIIPGLAVKRGSVDITVLVGSDMPIDPGVHVLVATAPGYVAWKHEVTIAPQSQTALEIPVLDKEVVAAPPPVVREGTLKITTLPTAQIILDNEVVGTGTVEKKVKSGGHTLRVVAGGMRPYQSEVFVGDGELRAIDIPLEKAAPATPEVVYIEMPQDDHDRFELAVSAATGFKQRNDNPLVVTVRAEAALRLGSRVNFGLFGEYGSIDTSNACGFDLPGPMPATPFDYGPRNQFKRCWYLMPGLQLYIHILPGRRVDPYLGISPGFRFGFAEWVEYFGGAPSGTADEFFPGIVVGARAGLDYRPQPSMKNWVVGLYIDAAITTIGDETSDNNEDSHGVAFVSWLGGLRTSIAF